MAAAEKEENYQDDAVQVLQLKLMVDKRKMRVVYAECGREMADVFFSFLTTPVGALVRRTGKDSGLGSMDSLYKSAEAMRPDLFNTPACRDLLLRPRSASGFVYRDLKIYINDADQVPPCLCTSGNCPKYSLFPGVKCDECGQYFNKPALLNYPLPRPLDAVFLREDLDSFIVTDDLFIAPSSDELKRKICLLAGFEHNLIYNFCLEEHIVSIDSNQMVELMKLSLLSRTPLTDKFLSSEYVTKPLNWPMEFLHQHLILASHVKTENMFLHHTSKMVKDFAEMITPKFGREKMTITLFHNHKTVLYAKAQKDFIDLLFSFLTFPMGSIVAAFGGHSSMGCLDNIHKVVNKFKSDGYFHSTRISSNLLNPPIAIHHSCENHLLVIGNQFYSVYRTSNCYSCNSLNYKCKNNEHIEQRPINPKYKGNITKTGGGYMRFPDNFVITNSLSIQPVFRCDEGQFFTQFLTGMNEKKSL